MFCENNFNTSAVSIPHQPSVFDRLLHSFNHGDGYFDYWGKGTQVTVSSVSQTKPSVPFIVSQCGPSTDGLLTFGCITSGFFPGSLEMEWTLGYGSKSNEMQFPAMKSQSNSYTAVSQVQISARDFTNNNSLTCAVKHPAGSETAKEMGYSSPVVHVGEVGESIMCLIEDFSPKKLSIKWKEDNREVKGIDWASIENPTGSFKAVSLLQANKTSKDTKYTCEVTHAAGTYVQHLSSKAKFSLKINPPSVKELFVHNRAIITCVITGDNKTEVEAANVSWTVGGQTPNPSTIVTDNGKETTPPFTKTSTLNISKSEWFSEREVKCSTVRDKTPFSETIKVKKGGEYSVLIYKPEKNVKDNENVFLLCEVSSSKLGDVYIMWQKNKDPYMEGSNTVHINANTVLSYLTMSGREYNNKINKFICAVKDANKENDTNPKITSTSLSKLPPCPPCPAN